MAAFQTGTTDFGESVPTALVSRLRMILDKTIANLAFIKQVQN